MRVVFLGTPDFAVASLDAIVHSEHDVVGVVTVPDRQAGRGQKVVYSPVKQYALDHGLPLLQPEKLRDPEFLGALAALGADIFVVVAFRMLPEAVWNMPPKGTFNLHASLLPAYRGAAPINWAIIRGEQRTGVTTFMLNHRIDEGNILLQAETPIAAEDNAGTLHDRLAEMGRGLVVATLDGLAAGTLAPTPQEGASTTAPKIFKEDTRIDFRQEGRRVVDFVRGLSPYPAATLTLRSPEGEEVPFKIYDVAFAPCVAGTPCRLESDGKTYIKIAANDGMVSILSLQMSGKRKNSVEEFLRGKDVSDWELIV
ncbi:MAG: methionyl-tRNA formyltransferase [Bacteroidales bacterium]|nr:methionyl-tRNA formyltransferase [Bacteroidales bacterium]